jgi:hypothetical protein
MALASSIRLPVLFGALTDCILVVVHLMPLPKHLEHEGVVASLDAEQEADRRVYKSHFTRRIRQASHEVFCSIRRATHTLFVQLLVPRCRHKVQGSLRLVSRLLCESPKLSVLGSSLPGVEEFARASVKLCSGNMLLSIFPNPSCCASSLNPLCAAAACNCCHANDWVSIWFALMEWEDGATFGNFFPHPPSADSRGANISISLMSDNATQVSAAMVTLRRTLE